MMPRRGAEIRGSLWLGLMMSWLLATAAMAQSPFDGKWKLDPEESSPSTAHYDYLLKDGVYQCSTCDSPFKIPADGQDHKITGDDCIETVGVKVIDDHTTEEIDKRNGRTVGTLRMTVSSNGDSAIEEWTESCNANGDVVSGKDVMARIAKGPAGSHAISGSWKISKRLNRSENALVITLKLTPDTFSFSDPTNQKYTAKLDGTETAFEGDLSHTMVSVRRVDVNTIEETDRRDGKVVQVTRFAVAADGKDMTVAMEDKVKGTKSLWRMQKQ